MHRRAFFAVLLPLTLCVAEDPSHKLDLKPEVLHPLLVLTSHRIQEKFRRIHPEAEGLVETVETILAMPAPEKKDHESDPAARMGSHMELMTGNFSLGATLSGVHGYILDNSDIGHQQAYQELERLTVSDADDVRRWLDMKYRAEQLKWKDKEEKCSQRAIGAARALVSREPKNAEAHALLAFALDWEDNLAAETLSSLETALNLDPGQPLARQLMLARRVDKAVETAALRRESRLDEKASQDTDRAMFDRPLDDAEFHAFTRVMEGLRGEVEKTLAVARGRHDIAGYLRTLTTGMSIESQLATAQRARQRDPAQDYNTFAVQNAMHATSLIFAVLGDEKRMHVAIELAADNGEALGTVAVMGMLNRVNRLMRENKDMSQFTDDTLFAPELQDKLMQVATGAETPDAARACEALCLVEMLRTITGRQAQHPEIILRMIELDPFRHRTLQFLLGACMTSDDTKNSAAAITRMQLAVLPCLLTRRQSAASAASLHDWESAFRHLDACDREDPGNLTILSQRVATTLRQSQSKNAIKKAGLLYSGITPDNVLEKINPLTKDERQQFLTNFILYHALKHDSETAAQLLKQSIDAKVHDERAAAPLREWMEK